MRWYRAADGGLFAGFFGANSFQAIDHGKYGLAIVFGVISFALYLYATWDLHK